MHIDGALVSFILHGDNEAHHTSGILFDSNYVLLSGTCLIPLIPKKEWISSFLTTTSSVLSHNVYLQKIHFQVFSDFGKKKNEIKKLRCFESIAIGAWKCPLIRESLTKLFYDWSLGHKSLEHESEVLMKDDIDLSKELMSVFVLLKCKGRGELEEIKGTHKLDDDIRALLNIESGLQRPNRGQEVEVVSTPFGNEHFINSLSRGIISNVVGCENCIILSDARTVSGCEGGPIFVSQRSRIRRNNLKSLLGIVSCPLVSWRGEWVGLTVAVSLSPVLQKLLTAHKNFYRTSVDERSNLKADTRLLNLIDETVVLVRSKSSWGSGVVLNATRGVIITCSHVVNNDQVVSIFHKGIQYSAEVIFKSKDDIAYDLSILNVRNYAAFKEEVSFSDRPAELGDAVIAAGFPFFSERDDIHIKPSVVTGCVSQVNPYMIQSTCCIQSGFSGGVLLRDGKLLGIIVSNAKYSNAGTLFPHINFIVPSSVFKIPVLKFIKSNDVNCLRVLECSDVKIQALWKLQTSKL